MRIKSYQYQKSTIPIEVKLPAGDIIKSTETGQLPNKDLPLESRKYYLIPDLKHVLLSIVLFCDNGCLAIFDKKEVRIIDKKTKKVIMRRIRDPLTKLVMYHLQLLNNFQQIQCINALAIFLH